MISASVTDDDRLMERALDLARAGAGLASPNPQVGCVLVQPEGKDATTPRVIGEGSHRYADRDHAEIVALKQAAALGNDTHGATAFVTLEPCSHHGRTGPCADALIAAGIRRCVVATADPNLLVRGKGIAKLQAAGIEVILGTGEQQARELNLAFAHFIQHQRPFVTLKAALSADGYLAPPAASRSRAQPHWLTGPESRAEVHRLRHASDAILTGIGTVLADDPALTDRSGLPRRRPLLRVVLDPNLRTPTSSHLLRRTTPATDASEPQSGDLLLLCAETAPADAEASLRAAAAPGVEIIRLATSPAGRLNLPAILALLAERSCLSLLLEAGSALNSAFLHEDLVDRVALFWSKSQLGPGSVPFAAGGPSPFLLEQRLQGRHERNFGDDVEVTGLLHDPWQAVSATLGNQL